MLTLVTCARALLMVVFVVLMLELGHCHDSLLMLKLSCASSSACNSCLWLHLCSLVTCARALLVIVLVVLMLELVLVTVACGCIYTHLLLVPVLS